MIILQILSDSTAFHSQLTIPPTLPIAQPEPKPKPKPKPLPLVLDISNKAINMT